MDAEEMLRDIGLSPTLKRIKRLSVFLNINQKCRLIVDNYLPHPINCYKYAKYQSITLTNKSNNRVFAVVDRPKKDSKYISRAVDLVERIYSDASSRVAARHVITIINYCKSVESDRVYLRETSAGVMSNYADEECLLSIGNRKYFITKRNTPDSEMEIIIGDRDGKFHNL